MKYESPQLVVLAPAVNAIQGGKSISDCDGLLKDGVAAYEDWEE